MFAILGGGESIDLANDLDGVYDIMDYADKFFNDHEKDTGGTLMKSLKKRKQSVTSGVSVCMDVQITLSLCVLYICIFLLGLFPGHSLL